MITWQQFLESKKHKKKKGIKMALDIEGEPVLVGTQKKQNEWTDNHGDFMKNLEIAARQRQALEGQDPTMVNPKTGMNQHGYGLFVVMADMGGPNLKQVSDFGDYNEAVEAAENFKRSHGATVYVVDRSTGHRYEV